MEPRRADRRDLKQACAAGWSPIDETDETVAGSPLSLV